MEPDDVVVGTSPCRIRCGGSCATRSEVHLATLSHELSVLQFDSHAVPTEAMVRASHTLCGTTAPAAFH